MVLEWILQMQSKHNLAIVTNGLLTASRASLAGITTDGKTTYRCPPYVIWLVS